MKAAVAAFSELGVYRGIESKIAETQYLKPSSDSVAASQ
jgi:hypothetical protein